MQPPLKKLFRKGPPASGSRLRGGRFSDPRFASFISHTNRKALNTDFKDAVLRGRKVLRLALVACIVWCGAWILVESAHALSMF